MADATRDLKIVISSDTGQAESSLSGFRGTLSRIGEVAAGIGLVQLTEHIANLGKEALTFSISYASGLEQARIAFDAFTGSADKGGKALQAVTEFARRTPFLLPDVVQAGQMLLGFGFSVDDLQQKLREVGSLATLPGRNMQEAVDLFARAREGIFNIREFGQFGIGRDALEQFGVAFNKAGSAIDKSQLLPALEKLINSRFGDLLKKESETLGGTVSNIKDDLGRLASTLVGLDPSTAVIMKGGIFDTVKKAAQGFLQFLDAHIGDIQAFGANIAKNLTPYVQFLGNVIQQQLNPVLKELQGLWQQHHQTITMIATFIAGVLVTAIVALIVIITTLVGIVAKVTEKFTQLVEFLQGVLTPVFKFLQTVFTDVTSYINKSLVPAVQTIVDVFNAVAKAIENAWNWLQKWANSKVSAPGIGGSSFQLPHRAMGGSASGLTVVGEQGPELVNLPSGSYVHSNSDSKKMMGGITVVINYPQLSSQQNIQQLIQDIKRALGRDAELAHLGAI